MNTFIKASLVRCIRTICQTAVAVIGTAFVLSDVNWWAVISASLLAGILSILTSVATFLMLILGLAKEKTTLPQKHQTSFYFVLPLRQWEQVAFTYTQEALGNKERGTNEQNLHHGNRISDCIYFALH